MPAARRATPFRLATLALAATLWALPGAADAVRTGGMVQARSASRLVEACRDITAWLAPDTDTDGKTITLGLRN